MSEAQDKIYLFEYDKRFQELYNEQFIHYDYNDPLKIPESFSSYFDVVLVDPPYLSEECLEKTLKTVEFVAKDKIILCTGIYFQKNICRMQCRSFNFKNSNILRTFYIVF